MQYKMSVLMFSGVHFDSDELGVLPGLCHCHAAIQLFFCEIFDSLVISFYTRLL